VGYEMGQDTYYTQFDVEPALIAIAQAHDASLQYTVYHFDDKND